MLRIMDCLTTIRTVSLCYRQEIQVPVQLKDSRKSQIATTFT